MAFQSGVTTSPNDLLDKIRLFAIGSCGYTQLLHQADAGYYRLHLQPLRPPLPIWSRPPPSIRVIPPG